MIVPVLVFEFDYQIDMLGAKLVDLQVVGVNLPDRLSKGKLSERLAVIRPATGKDQTDRQGCG